MNPYKTYIMGAEANIYFDRELIESLKDNYFWWRMAFLYRSNWRTLHIDGMEGYIFGGSPMPTNRGERVQFFNYKEEVCAKPS